MTRRFTPAGADVDSVIEPTLVLSSNFLKTEQESIPDYFWPVSGKWGIRGSCILLPYCFETNMAWSRSPQDIH